MSMRARVSERDSVKSRTVPFSSPAQEMSEESWLIGMFAEIAKVFWSDRSARPYARLRNGARSVPQVMPLRSTPAETT
ncbi:hypothetical protein AF336_06200 [Bradyrhizobium diazoefficiens]|nr:hypothetical protein BD122_24720 [Bradyrhizobium diazoefficiens]KOY10559.1 hypothetical protein AF336_06200 [Bradyrhizobium diazoefficiens]